MLSFRWVECIQSRNEAINDEVFDPWQNVEIKGHIKLGEGGVKILLKLFKGQLVTFFEFFIVLRKLLIAVVSQMDELVLVV